MMAATDDLMKLTCGKCRYLIGMADKDHISVKTGEFFIYFYGGMVIISCKNCHFQNIVTDDEFEKSHAEEVMKAEGMLNSVRALFSRWYQKSEHRDRDN